MDWLMRSTPPATPQPFDSTRYGMWYVHSGYRNKNILWVWLHGWGQSYRAFVPLLEQCEECGDHLMVDFPGFGRSAPPPGAWTTDDYAQHLHVLLEDIKKDYQQIIFIGHSFGCRVSLRYAARYPNTLSAMIFIGGAGLKRRLNSHQKLRRMMIRTALIFGKRLDSVLTTHAADWVRNRYGSSDYRSAGALRPILNNVVSEDLTSIAQGLTIPTLLIYGEDDSETPAEFGKRFHHLMPNSRLHILPGFDHYTILTNAKYQVSRLITDWVSQISSQPQTV